MDKIENLKMTRQRKFIVSCLENCAHPMTAEDIYKRSEKVNLSTIYRTLSTLAEMGVVLKSVSQDGKAYYQLNTAKHGHQLICSSCKQSVLIDTCPIEKLAKELEAQTGYQITGHNLEFTGICPDCRKEANRSESKTGASGIPFPGGV